MRPRIRIAQFTNTFHLGGGEVQMVELVRSLPRDQYDVHVLALDASGPLLEPLRAAGHAPVVFPLAGSVLRPATLTQVQALAQWLRRERIHLVHAHDFYAAVLAVPAARLAGCKSVVGRLDLAHWHGPARHALLAAVTHAADHVVANADAIRRFLIQRERLPARRISVIHNGLDLAGFDARHAKGLERPLPTLRGPVLSLVANMNHPVKRQEDFLDAFATVRQHVREATALLIGDGPRRPLLEQKARELGVDDAVHFLGRRTDVPAVLSHSTLGVLCSSHEGLSNAVMEGMAASLPMVVTDAGGNAELVADRVRGRVVPPLAAARLAGAILDLLDDPDGAGRMGQRGREYVAHHLALDRMVAEHDTLYRTLVQGEAERAA